MPKDKDVAYLGFEQGPIRPPSESYSLLIRVTRNCPWNKCTFCNVYKGSRFSIRPVDHVIKDIDAIYRHIDALQQMATQDNGITQEKLTHLIETYTLEERHTFTVALHWFSDGMKSIFIQDANSPVIKPDDLVLILRHLKMRFPWVDRITSYARSQTIVRIEAEDLKRIGEAGLNRIHIGMESGSDQVLKKVRKGVTKDKHILAGIKVKEAGIELSEYVMPGLGGRELSRDHALQTADALNQIDADFIRIRTLALPKIAPLYDEWAAGNFQKCTDQQMAEELLLFIDALEGISSTIISDHMLNLIQSVEGTLPQDKEKMIQEIKEFLNADPEQKCLYQVGRRVGLFRGMSDMADPVRFDKAKEIQQRLGITPENVDDKIDDIMRTFL